MPRLAHTKPGPCYCVVTTAQTVGGHWRWVLIWKLPLETSERPGLFNGSSTASIQSCSIPVVENPPPGIRSGETDYFILRILLKAANSSSASEVIRKRTPANVGLPAGNQFNVVTRSY